MIRPSLILALGVLAGAPAVAQQPDPAREAAERAAMAKLAWMNGVWRGPAVTQTRAGERRVVQTERIGPMLGGMVKVLEGKGFTATGTVGFNAFGIIAYDPGARTYSLHSYTGGRAGTFALTATERGYVWEIPAGPATIRYTATLADGVWTEVGDRILAGQAPQRFFEMKLRRVGDTGWPAADGPAPE